MNYFKLFLLTLVFILSACQAPMPEQSSWLGEVQLSGGRSVQLKMFLDLTSAEPSGYFLVGDEKTQIPEVFKRGDSLFLIISEYGAELKALWKNNLLAGRYYRYRADTTFLNFSASPVSLFKELPVDETTSKQSGVALVGNFRTILRAGEKVDSSKGATFWMKNDSIYGTILDQSGDHGLMVGKQLGTTIALHRFTGWQASMIELEYANGMWEGKYYIRDLPAESIMLVSIFESASEPLPTRVTKMRDQKAHFSFYGVTIEGDTIRNSDERFKGKALIVDIMGTWCHNCLDAAPLLQQLYTEFKDQGLEIIGLSFELKNDLPLAQKNLRIYSKRHGVTFPLLFTGNTERSNVDTQLRSQLEDFFAYPTTLFIDKKGRVKKIHSGFNGPGTGERYQKEIQTFYSTVRELLGK